MNEQKNITTVGTTDKHYFQFLKEAKNKILTMRIQIARVACQEQINLYWWFGQQIVEKQEKLGWGKSVVDQLAKDLLSEFPNSTYGFSARNLWDMRSFFIAYRDDESKLRQLVAEIPWGQNLLILHRVKNKNARIYYLEATRQMSWSRSVLTSQIDSQAYERHALAKKQHNFNQALPHHLAEQADKTMKDVYMLDTLGLTEPVLESAIEATMVDKIKNVMLELGYGFSFMGNQYRIIAEGHEYFIDLLFFNRKLNALVAIEIKRGNFMPEYAGKMNFYLGLLDDFVKEPHENQSIGIILCSKSDRFEAEYALRDINKPMGVSEYKLTKNLPRELSEKLPNTKKLEAEILKKLGSNSLRSNSPRGDSPRSESLAGESP